MVPPGAVVEVGVGLEVAEDMLLVLLLLRGVGVGELVVVVLEV